MTLWSARKSLEKHRFGRWPTQCGPQPSGLDEKMLPWLPCNATSQGIPKMLLRKVLVSDDVKTVNKWESRRSQGSDQTLIICLATCGNLWQSGMISLMKQWIQQYLTLYIWQFLCHFFPFFSGLAFNLWSGKDSFHCCAAPPCNDSSRHGSWQAAQPIVALLNYKQLGWFGTVIAGTWKKIML